MFGIVPEKLERVGSYGAHIREARKRSVRKSGTGPETRDRKSGPGSLGDATLTSSIAPPIQLGRSLADSIHAPRPTATRTRLRPHLLPRNLVQNQQSTLVHKVSLRRPTPKSSESETNLSEGAQRLAPRPPNPTHSPQLTYCRAPVTVFRWCQARLLLWFVYGGS
jgi:hypothetical protein